MTGDYVSSKCRDQDIRRATGKGGHFTCEIILTDHLDCFYPNTDVSEVRYLDV